MEERDTLWLGLERKWWVLSAIGMGTFMSTTNGSSVNAILPVIMVDLNVDLATVEWVTLVYLLVLSGLLLTFGRLGDMFGHKPLLLAGFAVFIVSSVLCALTTSALALVAARALQGVGSAMVFSQSPAILTGSFPARQRGQALGLQAIMTYLGLMVGPALGGYLVTNFGWQSVFLVNVPTGIPALVLAYLTIKSRHLPRTREHFDPTGAITFLVGLSALLLVLSHGQTWGWRSNMVWALLALAVVALVSFVTVERKVTYPMLDLTLFRNRLFTAATVSALLNYVSIYSVSLLMPFYLMQYRGMGADVAGLLVAAQAVTMMIFAPVSGTLSDRLGSRTLSTLGMGILAAALVWLGTVDAHTDSLWIAARLMLAGFGAALFTSPNTSALMGAAPRHQQGVASAISAEARNVGMVLGIAFPGAVFAMTLAARGGTVGPDPAFIPALQETLNIVAIVAVIGAITSMARGDKSR